jgi:two-component system, chemotaxis family, protein-glutamate methylesterase/glutaminase
MKNIRVLVVDDSVVIRKLVSEVLASDADIEVAGTAANGRICLAKIPQVNPDLVTLDVEMPDMNGLDALTEIRKVYPKLPVIMFSTLTERGAATTIEALARGASDYVTKPANVGSVNAAILNLRTQLLPKIKMFCGRASSLTPSAPAPSLPAARPPSAAGHAPAITLAPPSFAANSAIDAVAIGVSTGGPNALIQVLPTLPADFPVPVLIVQHMPPLFTRLLAERLNGQARLAVREAAPGAPVRPGEIWIAPGDWHMEVERRNGSVHLNTQQGPPENSCRPAVDVLFRSVARVYGSRVLAVILTGMGQDGLRGCRDIHSAGGTIYAQDEATSVVWGMPGFVAHAGIASRVLPLDQIGAEITRRVREHSSPVPLVKNPLPAFGESGNLRRSLWP